MTQTTENDTPTISTGHPLPGGSIGVSFPEHRGIVPWRRGILPRAAGYRSLCDHLYRIDSIAYCQRYPHLQLYNNSYTTNHNACSGGRRPRRRHRPATCRPLRRSWRDQLDTRWTRSRVQAALTSLSRSGCRSSTLSNFTSASGGLVLPFS